MGPVIGMSPDKKAETPGVQELVGSRAATCGMGTLPEAESAASPKATSVDKGLGDDEELTNLNWLHENLLQNFTLGTEAQPTVSPLYDIEGGGAVPASSSSCAEGREKDSLKSKPPYSFSLLIYMAIEQSLNKCLPVKEIYSWILDHFPYFANAPTGWKNSVRHNLSLNKCFRKVERNLGKTLKMLYCINPETQVRPLSLASYIEVDCFNLGDDGGKPQQSRALPRKRSYNHHHHHHSSTSTNSSRMPGVQDNPIDLSQPETAVVSNDPKEDHNYSATFQRCASRSSVSSLSSVDEAYEYTSQARRAGSEGFHSDEDSDLAEELEQAKDRLGDSGYGSQQRAAKGPASKKPRKEVRQEIDEELKEAAGSLLHLAGIHTCLDASRRKSKSKSKSKK
ncbi:UNVERIFIED_CONTAM: hypothetical protein FKN15_064153 [Acipenser sinensis]